MKFLVGRSDGLIRSAHAEPMQFSTSGCFVIDIPEGFLVEAPTDSVEDLINEKVRAFKTQFGGAGLPFSQNDELISSPNIDTSFCLNYSIGPQKRTALLPGGYVTTDILSINVETSVVYLHWYGFTLYSDPGSQSPDPIPETPSPPRLLYNYDPEDEDFSPFNSNDFQVRVFGQETTVSSGPINTVATSFNVASVAGFPSPPFSIMIDDETMTVSTVVGNTFTVTRPDPVNHSAGATVFEVLLTPLSDIRYSLSFGPGSVRIRFKNVSTKTKYLSDWILLHDEVT